MAVTAFINNPICLYIQTITNSSDEQNVFSMSDTQLNSGSWKLIFLSSELMMIIIGRRCNPLFIAEACQRRITISRVNRTLNGSNQAKRRSTPVSVVMLIVFVAYVTLYLTVGSDFRVKYLLSRCLMTEKWMIIIKIDIINWYHLTFCRWNSLQNVANQRDRTRNRSLTKSRRWSWDS